MEISSKSAVPAVACKASFTKKWRPKICFIFSNRLVSKLKPKEKLNSSFRFEKKINQNWCSRSQNLNSAVIHLFFYSVSTESSAFYVSGGRSTPLFEKQSWTLRNSNLTQKIHRRTVMLSLLLHSCLSVSLLYLSSFLVFDLMFWRHNAFKALSKTRAEWKLFLLSLHS